ncbi:MAG: glycosyltransferase [Thiobacillus sp.]|nr:glycosyltransferase [Thiobacillus sp.]
MNISIRRAVAVFRRGYYFALRIVFSNQEKFNKTFYLSQYPDIAASGIMPYEHFMLYGRREGRLGCPPVLEHIGDFAELDSARDTVLVVSHEASRTGAPVLSLNLVQILCQKYNVVALLLGGGMLESAFHEAGAVVVGPLQLRGNPLMAKLMIDQLLERCRFKFALINSIESRVVLPALASHFVPTISLIHEFAAYTRPREAFREALFWSGETIFSAQLTLESAHAEYPDLGELTAHILPQGRCQVPAEELNPVVLVAEELRVRRALRPEAAAKETVVILGAGFVQLRKGVDLFIECANRVVHAPQGAHCRFVWVGNGYDPEHDVGYSVYLADQIRRAGLERHVFFVEETPAIDVAYQQADLLLLSSRLDPLPNVAIDAMAHGVPVVCFARTTGIADFLIESGLEQECVAPYLDTADMAEKILALAGSKVLREHVSARTQQASLERFDMVRYVTNLEEIAATVEERTRQEQADVEEIEMSGLLRLDFFSPPHLQGQSPREGIRGYVRAWASGIGRRKLFPGFHPGIYLEQHGVEKEGVDPLADYLRAGQPDGPWRQPVITSEEAALPMPARARVALHLHVYYPDLLPDMLIRLARNRVRPDLFVSVPSDEVRDQVTRLLQEYAGKVVEIQVVPNRGRDIGPFLTAFGAQFAAGYDIVGHLHTKKTADIKDESLGKAWYRFLLENLLGGQANMADIILGRMAADPSIGMVFPDDPNVVGWGANKPFAQDLMGKLSIADLPEHLIFPIGTMFWARVDSIGAMFNFGLSWQDYPREPLPYDGSVLHAVERLFPFALSGASSIALTNVSRMTR